MVKQPASSALVFVSAYAPENKAGIKAFWMDKSTAELTFCGSFTGILNPSFITAHPNGRWLYAVSESSLGKEGISGGVCALSFKRDPFALRLLNRQPSGGDWPCHVQLDASGRWLFCANYGSGSAAVLPINEDGSLGEMSDRIVHFGSGPNMQRQEGPHVHSVTLSPDNQYALVADLGLDQIVIYKFDSITGKLSRHTETRTRPGAGPRHLAFHPNGRWLYLANELDNTVTLYDYLKDQGALIEKQTLSSLPSADPGNTLADIHVTASGQRLYASNRGHNSLAVYDIGSDGFLTLVSIPESAGNWPRNFALTSDGKFILVANQYSNEICVLALTAGTQALGLVLARAPMDGAACIQVI